MSLTVRDEKYFLATLSSMMLTAPTSEYIFDQFAFKGIDFKASKGDTVYLNRYPKFADAGLSLADRTLSETATIGTANPINQEVQQVPVILKELSGPYSSTANSVVPFGITERVALQAQQNIINSDNPTDFFNSIGAMSLKDDHDKFHDRVLINLGLSTTNVRNPDGVDDNNTALTGTGSTITTADLASICETLKTKNVPTFSDGLYYSVLCPRAEKHLRLDPLFRETVKYARPTDLFRGEIGVYEGFRFFSSNNIPTAIVNSLTAYESLFFGQQWVGYGEGNLPLQLRLNKNDDYARFMYLVWLVYRGYALLNGDFVLKARTFAA